jgi:hypothetical protein
MRAKSRAKLAWVVGFVVVATVVARLLGYKVGVNTIVRCRQGHLFTTIWIPGVKLKAVELGIARFQRCPVGRHWSLVVPVKESNLTKAEREAARSRRDIRLP